MTVDWKGVFPALMTEFREDESLDLESTARHLDSCLAAGIEGLGVQDDGALLEGTPGVGIGALTVGNVKYQVESGLFRKMIESDKPLYLDFRDAFALAREIVG